MNRLQLFEFEDLPFFPRIIREFMTDYLAGLFRLLPLYDRAVPIIAEHLKQAKSREILDLCSGSGGPWPRLLPRVVANAGDIAICFSDRYPPRGGCPPLEEGRSVAYFPRPVDARALPPEVRGLRVLFTALHHFSPVEVRSMLTQAAEAQVPLLAFELTERSLKTLLAVLLTPLLVWVITPFLRPFSLERLIWTYAIPLVPLMALLDGLLSIFRAYSCSEFLKLAREANNYDAHISCGKVASVLLPDMTYFALYFPPHLGELNPVEEVS